MESIEPDRKKLESARREVQTFLDRKSMWMKVLFFLAVCAEAGFLILMLMFTDFGDPTHRLIFVSVMLVYSPLILFVYRNSVRIDHLYYRLLDELKYKE